MFEGDGTELEILKAEFLNVEKTRFSAEHRQILTSRQDVTSQRRWNFILAVFLYLNHEIVCVCVSVSVNKGTFRFFSVTGFVKRKYLPYSKIFEELIKCFPCLG